MIIIYAINNENILNIPISWENGLIYKIISKPNITDIPQTYVRIFL